MSDEPRADQVPVEFVAAVLPGAVIAERKANWQHFHPERFCHLCGARNPESWFVPNEIWNDVADSDGLIDGAGIVCPQCFIERYEERLGHYVTWRIEPK